MSTTLHNARALFLETAARAYVQTDPATSAHLMAQRFATVEDAKFSGGNLCRACSAILIPGLTSTTSVSVERPVEMKGRRKSAKRKATHGSRKSLQTTCLKCHHYVKIALPQPSLHSSNSTLAKKESALLVKHFEDAGKATLTNATEKPATSNAGSRQRAKARKGGLQAMLEKSKKKLTSPSGGGLDLMDFLK